jgi:hypothetical protein
MHPFEKTFENCVLWKGARRTAQKLSMGTVASSVLRHIWANVPVHHSGESGGMGREPDRHLQDFTADNRIYQARSPRKFCVWR